MKLGWHVLKAKGIITRASPVLHIIRPVILTLAIRRCTLEFKNMLMITFLVGMQYTYRMIFISMPMRCGLHLG